MGLMMKMRPKTRSKMPAKARMKSNKDHSKGHPESKTYRKHLSILRTNHRIHSKAADLFYSELTILLEPSNVNLREDPFRPFEYGRSERVWRHDPLLGIGDEDMNGQHFYDSPKLNSVMEPYVFGRLRNISFHAMFVIPKTTFPFIHEDLSIDKDDEDKFTEYRGRTNIIRSLVKMISFSSTLTILNVHLGFQVNPFFPGVYPSDFPYLSKTSLRNFDLPTIRDTSSLPAGEQQNSSWIVALDPLYGLDNVKYFSLDFKKAGGEEELPQKLLDMAQDMKLSIERRYLARSLASQGDKNLPPAHSRLAWALPL